MPEILNPAVIGAGAWGTAFALHLWSLGLKPKIWAFEQETVESINADENPVFLPDIPIPWGVVATADINEALQGADIIFLAVPTQHIASVIDKIDTAAIRDGIMFVNLAKGIERGSGRLPSRIIKDKLPNAEVTTLSGPSFAVEVAIGKPTVMVAAGKLEIAERIQKYVAGPRLRVYRSPDLIGVELGGALKNVYALAAGLVDGLDLGENTRAALIVRGSAESRRLSHALGADNNTIFGIAGLGDLVLTCTSGQSRNHEMGVMLAAGRKPADVLMSVPWVAEGVYTAPAALELAELHGIDMPIIRVVNRVLEGKITPEEAVSELMTRPLKAEFDE